MCAAGKVIIHIALHWPWHYRLAGVSTDLHAQSRWAPTYAPLWVGTLSIFLALCA